MHGKNDKRCKVEKSHDIIPFLCQYCDEVFFQEQELKFHIQNNRARKKQNLREVDFEEDSEDEYDPKSDISELENLDFHPKKVTTRSNCSIGNERKYEDDESLDIRPRILKKYLITPSVKKKNEN